MRARLANNTSAWRRSQFASLETIARRYPRGSGPRWELMGDLLRKAGSDDSTLAADAAPALRLAGIIPASGRHKPAPLPEGVTSYTVQTALSKLLEAHAEERRWGMFRLPSVRQQEMLEILRTESSKGFWREHTVQEAGGAMKDWCGWLFFPVDSGDKVRGCLDPGGANELTHLLESCWSPGIDGVIALLGQLRLLLGNVRLRFCREDWIHGFRQLVLCAEDGRLLCALAWDHSKPKGEELRVFEPLVHLFGARAGGHQFCRGSIGLVEIANVWLAVCAESEIDEARDLFVRLAVLLQCHQNEAKAVPPRSQKGGEQSGKCLGPTLTIL